MILTPKEMADAERVAIAGGRVESGYRLMCNAGAAAVAEMLRRFPDAQSFDVLCGPGNNGGDGYVIARLLYEGGLVARAWALGRPTGDIDAAQALADCPMEPKALSGYQPAVGSVVVDALFGGGLGRPIEGETARIIATVNESGLPVVAVDLPSGVPGATGRPLGPSIKARLTVTFMCKRPGHLLYPGRDLCGEVVVADIGLPRRALPAVKLRENAPALWLERLPVPAAESHKYDRGHVGVFSGGAAQTGAARMSALGAARIGAGAVTVLSPSSAIAANAAHLTSVMLRKADGMEDVVAFVAERRPRAFVFGPGLDPTPKVAAFLVDLLGELGRTEAKTTIVVDASAITAAAFEPERLFAAARAKDAPALVLTPHAGEFARLFPDISSEVGVSKVEQARAAAKRANGIVVFKGPDTVIADPDDRAVVNTNGSPWLATAGSGDVLAGMIAGLCAQGLPAFEAACAAVWIHAEAGSRHGPGLIAEDLPGLLPAVLAELIRARENQS